MYVYYNVLYFTDIKPCNYSNNLKFTLTNSAMQYMQFLKSTCSIEFFFPNIQEMGHALKQNSQVNMMAFIVLY